MRKAEIGVAGSQVFHRRILDLPAVPCEYTMPFLRRDCKWKPGRYGSSERSTIEAIGWLPFSAGNDPFMVGSQAAAPIRNLAVRVEAAESNMGIPYPSLSAQIGLDRSSAADCTLGQLPKPTAEGTHTGRGGAPKAHTNSEIERTRLKCSDCRHIPRKVSGITIYYCGYFVL